MSSYPRVVGFLLAALPAVAAAQVAAADYARAEKLLGANAGKLVFRDRVDPQWIAGGDRFWYRVATPAGSEFIYVDPARRERRAAFDQIRLAESLGRAADTALKADSLPFVSLTWEEKGKARSIVVEARQKKWRCDLETYRCDAAGPAASPKPDEVASPDGQWVAFNREHNLYLRSTATGQERALTTDGEFRYEYGAAPESNTSFVWMARLGRKLPPSVVWSPDSKRLLTYRLDQRGRPELHLVQAVRADSNPRPKLWSYVYPLPGDTAVSKGEWVVFDAATGSKMVAKAPAFDVLLGSPIEFRDAWWKEDGSAAYIIQRERGVHAFTLSRLDASSGTMETVAEERGPTLVEASLLLGNKPNVRVLASGEVLWYSESSGWAHLYLISGGRRQPITSGPYLVRDVVHVDEAARKILFTAGGKEAGRDPLYRHLYAVNFDGTGLTLLTPEDAEHDITVSPTGKWAVDRYSRVDLAPVVVARSMDGKAVFPIERADISRLLATGWRYPERFTVKAADDSTDLYGIILRPSTFDSTKRYPVVEEIYPGPQIGKVPKSFTAGGDHAAIVELGFVGVEVDGRGTPLRSKAFHNYSYGHLDNAGGLEDHIAAYKQLGRRYPFLDLDRVGIFGHSGGGFASARAMFLYPDFYKVAVSSAGNHDQRGYLALWGETYQGMPAGDNYRAQANPSIAKNLKGKLMLAFGEVDDNVPPALTIQLIDALSKANKDYDLMIVPNGSHAMMADMYFRRRRWDYFVRWLLGAEPPVYEIKTKAEVAY